MKINPYVLPPLISVVAIALAVGYVLGYVDTDIINELAIYLAFIGIGLTGALFIIQQHQAGQIDDIVSKTNSERERRREHVQRMYVIALREIRQTISGIESELTPLTLGTGGSLDTARRLWHRLNVSGVDRLAFLNAMAFDVVDFVTIDTIETLKNALKEEFRDEPATMASILGFARGQMDIVFRDDFREMRIQMAHEEERKFLQKFENMRNADDADEALIVLDEQSDRRRLNFYYYSQDEIP